ncbi:MAG TPA: Gfo/Idh/MocA family oxidoreductase [Saprospiraceae bacterium]|mgnify:CR=1 FL=1|nr:Gfo/Idh/MocA family oxidoreductase [Lewinellaceae bacterium]HPG06678.1 Gfo/Idh/MocA family oxidoreductase [Saprospiraceae bacterium]HRV87010.1 Gfo/Idh/MocA family oxidoreductase [Saprospiraceae bacterium]
MNRRNYLRTSLLATTGIITAPTIVPASVFGKSAPSNKINIAQIGCGRIARDHDLAETLKYDVARVVAVAELDSIRGQKGKEYIEKFYAEKKGKPNYVDVKVYGDYREMLMDKDIDAVIISTPDHWHAKPAIDAALAGKDIYLQKPASLTIEEGRLMSDTMHRTGRIFQIGSQQRSQNPWPQFKRACELVRNGRIGALHTVKIGLPGDPGGPEVPEMPIPANLNYDMWLGTTPEVYYTETRVHPQADFSRPGWLRCEQFGAGMITGWGAHHIDTAHWGMGTEYTGPIEVQAEAKFPTSGLWNVHGDFIATAKYANGVTMYVSGDYPNGVRFEGSEGWIFVSRGNVGVTASDPSQATNSEAFSASDARILQSVIGPDEIHLYDSPEQHGNWLDCIISRQQPVAPAEIAHRSCSACLVIHIGMKLNRKLYWDPVHERFRNDDEANSMLSRPQRPKYAISI